MIGGTRRTARSTVTIERGPSRSIATSAVRIFVVEAMWQAAVDVSPQSTLPVSASTRIAARALSLIPCAGSGPVGLEQRRLCSGGRRREHDRREPGRRAAEGVLRVAPYPYGQCSFETFPRWTSSRAPVDDPLAVDAARRVLERAREEIRAGGEPGDLGERAARRARRRAAARAPARAERDRRDRPHEPRARAAAGAALERVLEVGARLLEPRVRPRRRRARLAAGPPRRGSSAA